MNKSNEIFVTRNVDSEFSITDEIKRRGFSYACPILENKVIEANKLIAEKLQLPIASRVCSFCKLRVVEGQPVAIEQIYIDENDTPSLSSTDMNHRSFYQWCKTEYGYEVMRSEEEIKVVHASEKEASLLKIKPDDEVMMLEGVTYKTDIKPFEFFQIISIPGFYRFRSCTHGEK